VDEVFLELEYCGHVVLEFGVGVGDGVGAGDFVGGVVEGESEGELLPVAVGVGSVDFVDVFFVD